MVFGAWRTALAISAINALALAVRLHVEELALEDAETDRVHRSISVKLQVAEAQRRLTWG
jgi:hypothetical protein